MDIICSLIDLIIIVILGHTIVKLLFYIPISSLVHLRKSDLLVEKDSIESKLRYYKFLKNEKHKFKIKKLTRRLKRINRDLVLLDKYEKVERK